MHAEKRPSKIRVIIVDDEPLARSNLTVLLRRDAEVEIIRECSSGEEALTAIRAARPDLVFLDVQMPECDGFDVLEMLGNDLPPAVVLVTAHDQYALRAFDAGALDYLLKPFDNTRFELALGRAKEKVAQQRGAPQRLERLVIKSTGQVLFVKIADIDWIEAADYYSSLHVGAKTHLLRRSLTELDQELNPAEFCRIHRSTIVKLDRVRGMELTENGEHEVLLDQGVKLRMSRRYRKELQSRLGVRALEL